jgi:hypothetical protein
MLSHFLSRATAESGNTEPQQPQREQEPEEVLQLRASVERMESQARIILPLGNHVVP